MKDLIFEFADQYAVLGILAVVLLAVFLLWRMHRQVKKLNRNLGMITGKIQEYFNVIMEDEEPEGVQDAPARDTRRSDWEVTKEERDFLLSGRKEQHPDPEDEAVFNAVMQEYFS